jgi:integrase
MDIGACSYYSAYVSSLTKRSTSKFWVACFTDGAGRRLKRSTATTNRKEALKLAEAFEEAARRKRTALQTRRVIMQLHRDITGTDLLQTSVRSFLDDWLERKSAETAPNTMVFYRNAAAKFVEFLGSAADTDLEQITRDDLVRFRNEQHKRFAPKTVNHLIKFLRMIFRAAKRDALISDDPAEFVDGVRQQDKPERRPFTLAELRALLAVAEGEWRTMILFGLYTGQRLGDIACLTWANVDLSREEIRLVTRKTRKRLILPIAPPLMRHLEALPSTDDASVPVHPHAHAIVTKQGKSGQLSNQFSNLLAQAGLRQKQMHRKTHGEGRGRGSAQSGVSFHCLRHTAVTLLKEAGVPSAVVMELIGHDSEQMSEHYTHVGQEAMKKATDSFPDLL